MISSLKAPSDELVLVSRCPVQTACETSTDFVHRVQATIMSLRYIFTGIVRRTILASSVLSSLYEDNVNWSKDYDIR